MNLKALQKLSHGLYVVTSKRGERLNGQVANTVFQITSEPPTIAVSINKNNLTWEFIRESRVFAVSVLCQDTPLSFIGHFQVFRTVFGFETSILDVGKKPFPVIFLAYPGMIKEMYLRRHKRKKINFPVTLESSSFLK